MHFTWKEFKVLWVKNFDNFKTTQRVIFLGFEDFIFKIWQKIVKIYEKNQILFKNIFEKMLPNFMAKTGAKVVWLPGLRY